MGRRRIEPGQGQESVWDYPRPPRLEDVDKKVKVVFGGVTLAYTTRAKRVLETSHPPRVLHPARGREDGASGALGWELALRVEGACQLLRRDYRREDGEAGGVVLPRPDAAFRPPRRLRRLLPFQDGRVLGRGGENRGAGRGLLRGLDHLRHSRPFHWRSRHLGLVDTPWMLRASARNTSAQAWTKPT